MRAELSAVALAGAVFLSCVAQAAPSAAEMEQAGNLFAISCSSSFCHGPGGVGARGPTLRNRDFPPGFVRDTILNGRSGTAMPSFRNSFSQDELNMIVGYVMSLSPNNHAAEGAPAEMDTAGPPPPLSDQAQRGWAIFFDLARPAACAFCHSYDGHGGPIGPDLDALAKQSPADIFRSIVHPPTDSGYPAVTVATNRGATITGIEQSHDDGVTRLYDLSSVPPVLRSVYASDGAKIEKPAPLAPLYTHALAGLSNEDIADLIAFLKSADPAAPAAVAPKDFARAENP